MGVLYEVKVFYIQGLSMHPMQKHGNELSPRFY